jgi:hypothetical protein
MEVARRMLLLRNKIMKNLTKVILVKIILVMRMRIKVKIQTLKKNH